MLTTSAALPTIDPPTLIADIVAAAARLADPLPPPRMVISWLAPKGAAYLLKADLAAPQPEVMVVHPETLLLAVGASPETIDALPPGWVLRMPGLAITHDLVLSWPVLAVEELPRAAAAAARLPARIFVVLPEGENHG